MSLKYRPEIDGLRAVSVMAVIIYHAGLLFQGKNILSGGFIGVDIFFVISGYLITSIILKETGRGTFSFVHFYIRRIRRILPALFTVMIVSLPFAWLYLMPHAVKEYAGSVLSSLFFVSNIWFWQQDSYWAVDSKLKPFLHTWSLSVEEQFYILYPLTIALLWKYARKYILGIMIGGFFCSLFVAHFASEHFATAGFYLLPTRGWELLGGGILAKLGMEQEGNRLRIINGLMPKIGILLILGSFFLFDHQTQHPSFMTLFPVFGSMLLIRFCSEGELVTKILSSRIFVGVGLISYGLYIWHYPIFAFAQIRNPFPSSLDKTVWITSTFLLSVLTYFMVEKPARNFKTISTERLMTCLIASFLFIAGVTGYTYFNGGLWGRFQDWQIEYMGIEGQKGQSFSDYVSAEYDRHRALSFQESSNKKRLLIIGDSYSQDIFNVLKEGGLLDDIEVITNYIPARCQNVPADVSYEDHIKNEDIETCRNVYRVGHPALDKAMQQADMIIVTAAWDDYTTPQIPRLYAELKRKSRAKIIVFGRKEFYEMKMQDILSIHSRQDVILLKKSTLDKDHMKHVKLAGRLMSDNKDYIDLHQVICGEGEECPVSTPNGFAISYDGGHLTKEGACYVSDILKDNSKFVEKWRTAFE
ncbi:MAG TPA: hypothetical protein DEA55_03260 [Rhodospirillaceae bacterium]|nr:hypothetical protein [Rhodospirillaceae bacterium]